ncbi:MAG: hypothetical protein AAF582_00155 [Pseudomonadota bacterium]
MCDFIFTPLAAAATTAGGATAGATTIAGGLATALQVVGLATSIAAPIMQANAAADAERDYAAQLEAQAAQTRSLNAVQDQRTRAEYRRAIAQQRANFSERNLDLGSPSAEFLGQTAAREMAFASQSVRQTGQAQTTELTNQANARRSRARIRTMTGGFTAASNALEGVPQIWPELLE